MKLWVDDIRKAPEGWTHAKTVTDAIRLIHNNPIEEISLDHDISHDIMLDNGNVVCRPYPCGETFEPVARFIAILYNPYLPVDDMRDGRPGKIKINIHTANPAGAERIKNILMEFNPTVTLGKPCNRWEDENGD